MENYEQRYKEALERAKCMHEQGMMPERLEYVFPELKESEDEKIRKAIKEAIESYWSDDTQALNDALAWLEKQGEPTEINPSEFDSQLNRLLKQFESLPKEELASSLSFYLNVVQNDGTYKDEKQGEQKPTAKVEPKFKVGDWVRANRDLLFQKMKEAGYEWDAEKKELKKTEQKPIWSKEDEVRATQIISDLEKCFVPGFPIFIDDIELKINWLKSLIPQNRWKPSEEQLTILKQQKR